MAHSAASVEQWLDANPDVLSELFLRKADLTLINRWMTQHGLQSLPDSSPVTGRHATQSLPDSSPVTGRHATQSLPDSSPVTGRHATLSSDSSAPSSPIDTRFGDSGFFDSRHNRSNSKKYLRQDFARSKMKNMFRTYEPVAGGSLEQRRSSLKEMRQFRSLPPTSVNMLSVLIQSKVRLPRYPSKDIDHKRELRYTNEREFFLEIVKDISNDLDLKSLTGKMVVNISCLADAERASLFLVEGKHSGRPSLVSKFFDVHAGTNVLPSTSGDSRIPWGQGILGHVAETGEVVNLRSVKEDPRFNDEVGQITGCQAKSLLCQPIRNADDEIVGVAQLLNKTSGDGAFSEDDEKLLATYLTFCGIAIYNAQLFDAYTKEYERNKALLEVVHDLFEEQTSTDSVVLKIMQRAQTLLKCERCSVLLRDGTSETSFRRVFDLSYPMKNGHAVGIGKRRRQCRQETTSTPIYSATNNDSPDNNHDLKLGNKIAELVLITGETINITDASQDPRFDVELDRVSGMHTRSIMCKPVRNRDCQTIGVAQVVNRVDGQAFDEHDDQLFEAFVIFCGLGISNCQLYEEVSLSAARQTVALEVLSYHTAASMEEVIRLKTQRIPECSEWRLAELDFNDFSLDRDQMMVATVRIFLDLGLLKKLRLDTETLCRWLLTVRRNYRNVAYHNWRHAFNVCQVMFAVMTKCNTRKQLTDNETIALIVGCLCHDLDHRGTNNAFQHKTSSALCQLYGTKATLEHHHFNHAVMILSSEGHNILGNLGSEDYTDVINLLKHSILATDLSLHVQLREKYFSMVESGQTAWDDRESKEIYRSVLMTACDIAAITKPWDVQRRAADLVVTEFFDQGDKEKQVLKLQPQACMDREKQDEVARLQLSWIDGVCLPLYKALAKMDPGFRPMMDGVLANRAQWERLDAERLSKHAVLETGV